MSLNAYKVASFNYYFLSFLMGTFIKIIYSRINGPKCCSRK
jgi:hypothetical protein